MNHPQRRYDMVIFDVDGTLVDTSDAIIKSSNQALAMIGYDTLPKDVIRKCIGPPLAESMFSKGLLKEKDKDLFLTTFRTIYRERMVEGSVLYDGIVDVLKTNKENGVINSIATNKPVFLTEKLLHELNIESYFEVVIGSNPERFIRKEDMIKECLAKTKITSDRALYVGDTYHDKEAADKNSVDFIGVGYGFGFDDTDDDIVKTPKGLMKHIYC